MYLKLLIVTTTLLIFSSIASAEVKLQVEYYSNNYSVTQSCEDVIGGSDNPLWIKKYGSMEAAIKHCITTMNADRKLQAQHPIADLYCHLGSLQQAIEIMYATLKEKNANQVNWDGIEAMFGTSRGRCIRSFLAEMKGD